MDDAMGRIAVLVALLGIAICAAMAAFGFKGRISVVGVDLGTTFSVVAVNEHGTVRVINDSYGDPLVPSIVSFLPKGKVAVGKEARRRLAIDPLHTIYNAKRFIGRDLSDPTVELEAARHPFKVVAHAGNHSGVGFALSLAPEEEDEGEGGSSLAVSGHPAVVSPEEVGASILRRLLDMTADYLGHRQVTKAVIAVPAKFNARQKRATGEAYRRAGLKVMRVLEEPTAAAIAYGLHQKPNVHHILVYDFGGGTLDVSLLYVHNGFVTVESVDGDDHLGGADFDHCLARHLTQVYGDITEEDSSAGASSKAAAGAPTSRRQAQGHKTDEPLSFEEGAEEAAAMAAARRQGGKAAGGGEAQSQLLHECASYTMLAIAEHLKKALSSSEEASFRCRRRRRRGGKGEGKGDDEEETVTLQVTRAAFENQACGDVFARALAPVDRVLENLGMQAKEVDEVVMVGGTTRIPKVREMLRRHLGVESLNTHIDPDVTVAVGAACVVD